jgi:hypothetical protein
MGAISRSFLFTVFGLALLGSTLVRASERAIAAQRDKDLAIVLTNEPGELHEGNNGFCVLFQRDGTADAADVRDVALNFILVVGRMWQQPRPAFLIQDGVGRYCGTVNLGRLYYSPSNFYVILDYVDVSGNKRSKRFFVAVR